MSNTLERRLGWLAIPNLTSLLVFGQLGAFVLSRAEPRFTDALLLLPNKVFEGQVWRVASFVFVPTSDSMIFILFELYLLYLYGQALESLWGALRYTLFVLIGWVATAAAAFLFPYAIATNLYLMLSIFLAFAQVNPEFELRLFFVLPVKIKHLGWFTWAYFGYSFFSGPGAMRAAIAAGTLNFFLFFGKSIYQRARYGARRKVHRAKTEQASLGALHRCSVCGITSDDDKETLFRYCSKCDGTPCFCENHLAEHNNALHRAPTV